MGSDTVLTSRLSSASIGNDSGRSSDAEEKKLQRELYNCTYLYPKIKKKFVKRINCRHDKWKKNKMKDCKCYSLRHTDRNMKLRQEMDRYAEHGDRSIDDRGPQNFDL